MNEEEMRKKQKEDLERILALALIKNLYNQGKISEYVYRKSRVIQRRKWMLKIDVFCDKLNM